MNTFTDDQTSLSVGGQSVPKDSKGSSSNSRSASEIRQWIADYLADLLEVDKDEIDTSLPFDRYGLDSSAAVGMTGDLEDWLGVEVDPTVIYDYPTVDALSSYLGS